MLRDSSSTEDEGERRRYGRWTERGPRPPAEIQMRSPLLPLSLRDSDPNTVPSTERTLRPLTTRWRTQRDEQGFQPPTNHHEN